MTLAYAALVDDRMVNARHLPLRDVLPLGVVGVAKTDDRNVLGSNGRLHARDVGRRAVTMTEQVRERHAVHVT